MVYFHISINQNRKLTYSCIYAIVKWNKKEEQIEVNVKNLIQTSNSIHEICGIHFSSAILFNSKM